MTGPHTDSFAGLIVDDRVGSQWPVDPSRPFFIGREGDLAFRDNPYMHGRLIGLAFHEGLWWLSNVGRYIPVRVIDLASGAQTTLRSGSSQVIVSDLLVVFEAGPTTYELALLLTKPVAGPELAGKTASFTIDHGQLTADNLKLLTAMAEPLLRYPGTGLDRIPTTPAVAERLGWPVTRVNRALDRICERLADAGVSGLVSDGRSGTAVNRRMRLVEYALDTRLVTAESLPLLDT